MDATILGHVMRAPLCRCIPSLFIVNWTYFEGGKLLYLLYHNLVPSVCLYVCMSVCMYVCMSEGCSLIAPKLIEIFSQFKQKVINILSIDSSHSENRQTLTIPTMG